MTGTNTAIIDKMVRDYTKYVYDVTEKELKEWCYQLMTAAYKFRLGNPRSHEFTGNLINSIMVGLYRERRPIYACIVGDRGVVKAPIMGKMRVRRSTLGYGAKMYRFKQDWMGTKSAYVPEVQTDGGSGINDARRFFRSYTPDGDNMFDLVVAYPVEYASWIEQQRQSTGILQTYSDAKATGMKLLQVG